MHGCGWRGHAQTAQPGPAISTQRYRRIGFRQMQSGQDCAAQTPPKEHSPSPFIAFNGTCVYWFSSTEPLSDSRKVHWQTGVMHAEYTSHPSPQNPLKTGALDNVPYGGVRKNMRAEPVGVIYCPADIRGTELTPSRFYKAFVCVSR